jgi:hypothetical protein
MPGHRADLIGQLLRRDLTRTMLNSSLIPSFRSFEKRMSSSGLLIVELANLLCVKASLSAHLRSVLTRKFCKQGRESGLMRPERR